MAAIPESIVELFLDDEWVDVTEDVRQQPGISISRGRGDERSRVSPSTCTLTLDNTDGTYSARNPSSAYFGQLGRNTPIRVRVDEDLSYLQLFGSGYATTPDHSSLDITGDIDIRVDLEPNSWRPNAEYVICGKYLAGGQRSWALRLLPAGNIAFNWSTNGSSASSMISAAVPADSGRLTIRVTFDVNNGSGGKTATFYTGTGGVAGSFTQLSTLTTAGTTSIFSSSAALTIGALDSGGTFTDGTYFVGRVYGMQVRNGIGGTVVANPGFTAQTPDDDSITDSTSKAWTFTVEARIGSDAYRFHGEVSEWPPRWDITGSDVTVPIQASGIMRRLGAGSVVRSPLRDFMEAQSGILAYFPCEDGSDATRPGNAAPNGVIPVANDVSFGSDSDLPASDGVMTNNSSSSSFSSLVRATSSTGNINFVLLFRLASLPGGTVELCRLLMTGAITLVTFQVTDTTSRISLINADGSSAATTVNTYGAEIDVTQWTALCISLTQDGSNIDYFAYTHDVGGTTVYAQSGTVAGTVGRPTGIALHGALSGARFAHLIVTNQSFPFVTFGLFDAVSAYDGESAVVRMERLCEDAGITFRTIRPGLSTDPSTIMGAQRRGTLLELLQAAAEADGGILFEPRDWFGLCYRTRDALQNQGRAASPLALGYTDLAGDLAPTDDDQGIANDITVTRTAGGSFRAVQETGPLSVQDPGDDPQAVGRYATVVDLATGRDEDLPGLAGHRLNLGTWDEARYPVVTVHGHNSDIDSTMLARLLRTDVGDRFTIDDPPAWLPPDQIAQLAQGLREEFDPFSWRFQVNASPAGPWDVGVYDDDDEDGVVASRYSSAGTTRPGVTPIDSTQTSITFDTPSGPLWTEDDDEFPFDIMVGGERMTVTDIAADTGTRQIFTVTRSVNGVVKGHPAGVAVELFRPARYGM